MKIEVARDAKQYFLCYSVPCHTETLEVTDDADYMRVAIESATPNGACGAKAVWTHLDSFVMNLRSFATNMLYHHRRAGGSWRPGLSSFARGS
jgi:hypothetical protein